MLAWRLFTPSRHAAEPAASASRAAHTICTATASVNRGDLDRFLAHHGEERLQVECHRPQRVRPTPSRHELQIYEAANGTNVRLLLFEPAEDTQPSASVVLFHDGALRKGSPDDLARTAGNWHHAASLQRPLDIDCSAGALRPSPIA
jgi:hypothetical protein